MKTTKTTFRGLIGLGVAAALAWPAAAEYPERAIEFVIPFGAGGGADIEGRLLAKEMSAVLGQPVVAVNKPGAGGAVTYTYVKNAKPDGYVVAWNSTSILTTTNIGNVTFEHSALDHIGRVEYQPMATPTPRPSGRAPRSWPKDRIPFPNHAYAEVCRAKTMPNLLRQAHFDRKCSK